MELQRTPIKNLIYSLGLVSEGAISAESKKAVGENDPDDRSAPGLSWVETSYEQEARSGLRRLLSPAFRGGLLKLTNTSGR
jgi:hypothetical protein